MEAIKKERGGGGGYLATSQNYVENDEEMGTNIACV